MWNEKTHGIMVESNSTFAILESEKNDFILKKEYEYIYSSLKKLNENKYIDDLYLVNLVDLTQRLTEYVAMCNPKVKEEVNYMGGEVLELLSDKLLEKMERGREEGREKGREEGRLVEEISLICKKLKKNMSPSEINELLEFDDLSHVETICDIAKKYAPDYDEEKILEEYLTVKK